MDETANYLDETLATQAIKNILYLTSVISNNPHLCPPRKSDGWLFDLMLHICVVVMFMVVCVCVCVCVQ